MFFTIVNDSTYDDGPTSENDRYMLSYLGRAEAVMETEDFSVMEKLRWNENIEMQTESVAVQPPIPPPRPPKPTEQSLQLFSWKLKQQEHLDKIRQFGHDPCPPERPPKTLGMKNQSRIVNDDLNMSKVPPCQETQTMSTSSVPLLKRQPEVLGRTSYYKPPARTPPPSDDQPPLFPPLSPTFQQLSPLCMSPDPNTSRMNLLINDNQTQSSPISPLLAKGVSMENIFRNTPLRDFPPGTRGEYKSQHHQGNKMCDLFLATTDVGSNSISNNESDQIARFSHTKDLSTDSGIDTSVEINVEEFTNPQNIAVTEFISNSIVISNHETKSGDPRDDFKSLNIDPWSKDSDDYQTKINEKRDMLVNKIEKRIEDYQQKKLLVSAESLQNDDAGKMIEHKLQAVSKTTELEKFKSQVDDVEKVTALLLCLAGRLAKIENMLAIKKDTDNKISIMEENLGEKKHKLLQQLEEAKVLKKNIDKRTETICGYLTKYFGPEVVQGYRQFLAMKIKLIIETKELNDKTMLSEEQLRML